MEIKRILTDEQKAGFVTDIIDYGTDFVAPLYATVDAIEQVVLQSEQVQAWKRDSERLNFIERDNSQTVFRCGPDWFTRPQRSPSAAIPRATRHEAMRDAIDAAHPQGTRHLCLDCEQPIDRREKSLNYHDNFGPLCDECYFEHPEAQPGRKGTTMLKTTMPEPVGYFACDPETLEPVWDEGCVCQNNIYNQDDMGTVGRSFIFSDQAEAYADAKVREALEESVLLCINSQSKFEAESHIRALIPQQ